MYTFLECVVLFWAKVKQRKQSEVILFDYFPRIFLFEPCEVKWLWHRSISVCSVHSLIDSPIQMSWPSCRFHTFSVSDHHLALLGRSSPGWRMEMPFESSKWWKRMMAHWASRRPLRTFHRNTELPSSTLALQRQVQMTAPRLQWESCMSYIISDCNICFCWVRYTWRQ